LELPVVIEDGELDGVPPGVQAHSELRLAPGVGDADQLPPALGGPPVAEGGDEAELLGQALVKHPQCRHYEVGRGVDPIGGLHPVRAPHPGHARVSVQVNVKLELSDEVEALEVVIPRLVVGTRVLDRLNCGCGGGAAGCGGHFW